MLYFGAGTRHSVRRLSDMPVLSETTSSATSRSEETDGVRHQAVEQLVSHELDLLRVEVALQAVVVVHDTHAALFDHRPGHEYRVEDLH